MDAEPPRDNSVNDVTVKVGKVSLAPKEISPVVKIEVTEHEEDEGDTHTEVREVKTSKGDDDEVEETKEVTKVSKTNEPGGGQVTIETKQSTTKTTRKGFMGKQCRLMFFYVKLERLFCTRTESRTGMEPVIF